MQGGRSNAGRATYNLGGKMATKLGGAPAGQVVGGRGQGQSTQLAPPVPAPVVHRPVPATPTVPRAGTREIANVDNQGLIDAGKVTTGGVSVTPSFPDKS